MNSQKIGDFSSESLMNKNICYAYYNHYEPKYYLNKELCDSRAEFYNNSKMKIKVNIKGTESGMDSRIVGTISNRVFAWKKIVGKIKTAECYLVGKDYVLLLKDLEGEVYGKIFYDKNLDWIKTEYHKIDDEIDVRCIISPCENSSQIKVFEYDDQLELFTNHYFEQVESTNEIIENDDIAKIVVTTDKEILYYVRKDVEEVVGEEVEEEVKVEKEDIDDLKPLTMPEKTDKDTAVFDFINELDEAVKEIELEAEKEVETVVNTIEDIETEEKIAEEITWDLEEEVEEIEETIVTAEQNENVDVTIIEPANKHQLDEMGINYSYTGKLISGKKEGRGRLESESALTLYDGTFKDDKKEGFGVAYSDEGNILYAGFWEENKKQGVGVSFKETDKTVTVSNWNKNSMCGNVSVYDSNAKPLFVGNLNNGKRVGVGYEYDPENDVYIFGKFDEETNECIYATIFDNNGNMMYSGEYKDGKKNGKGTEFYEDGEILSKGTFKDDNLIQGTYYKKI